MQALPAPKTEEDKGDKKEDDGEREAKKLKTSESLESAAKAEGKEWIKFDKVYLYKATPKYYQYVMCFAGLKKITNKQTVETNKVSVNEWWKLFFYYSWFEMFTTC